MTVVGRVLEPSLTDLVEAEVLTRPKRHSKHSSGIVMSMLAAELSCRLGEV